MKPHYENLVIEDEWDLAAAWLHKESGVPPTCEEIEEFLEYQSKRRQDDAMEPDNDKQ